MRASFVAAAAAVAGGVAGGAATIGKAARAHGGGVDRSERLPTRSAKGIPLERRLLTTFYVMRVAAPASTQQRTPWPVTGCQPAACCQPAPGASIGGAHSVISVESVLCYKCLLGVHACTLCTSVHSATATSAHCGVINRFTYVISMDEYVRSVVSSTCTLLRWQTSAAKVPAIQKARHCVLRLLSLSWPSLWPRDLRSKRANQRALDALKQPRAGPGAAARGTPASSREARCSLARQRESASCYAAAAPSLIPALSRRRGS